MLRIRTFFQNLGIIFSPNPLNIPDSTKVLLTYTEYGTVVGYDTITTINSNNFYTLNGGSKYATNEATLSFKTTQVNLLILVEIRSSSASLDYMCAGLLDNDSITDALIKVSGNNSSQVYVYTVPSAGDHYIKFFFRNSASFSSNQNKGYFRLIPFDNSETIILNVVKQVEVKAYTDWTLYSKSDWIDSFTPLLSSKGKLTANISVLPNYGDLRSGNVTLQDSKKGLFYSLIVNLELGESLIKLSRDYVTVNDDAGSVSIDVTLIGLSTLWTVLLGTWYTISKTSGASGESVTISWNANTGSERSANIVFRGQHGETATLILELETYICHCDCNTFCSCDIDLDCPTDYTNACSCNAELNCSCDSVCGCNSNADICSCDSELCDLDYCSGDQWGCSSNRDYCSCDSESCSCNYDCSGDYYGCSSNRDTCSCNTESCPSDARQCPDYLSICTCNAQTCACDTYMCTSHLTASCGGFSCSCWDVCSCNMDGNAHYNYTEGSCGSDICDCNDEAVCRGENECYCNTIGESGEATSCTTIECVCYTICSTDTGPESQYGDFCVCNTYYCTSVVECSSFNVCRCNTIRYEEHHTDGCGCNVWSETSDYSLNSCIIYNYYPFTCYCDTYMEEQCMCDTVCYANKIIDCSCDQQCNCNNYCPCDGYGVCECDDVCSWDGNYTSNHCVCNTDISCSCYLDCNCDYDYLCSCNTELVCNSHIACVCDYDYLCNCDVNCTCDSDWYCGCNSDCTCNYDRLCICDVNCSCYSEYECGCDNICNCDYDRLYTCNCDSNYTSDKCSTELTCSTECSSDVNCSCNNYLAVN